VVMKRSLALHLVNPYPLGNRHATKCLVQLRGTGSQGIRAGVVLPIGHGLSHLAPWAEREKVDLIVIPDFLVHPGLIERIKGYSLKTPLDNTALPVLVYHSGDTALAVPQS
jgi:hypothetical protein